jgi:signal recognition particle subunit SRP54
VPEVNRVLKQWKQMSVMMKKVRKMGKAGMMRAGLSGILPKM